MIGDSQGAKEDLEKALDLVPNFVQAWVKIASVHMELGKFYVEHMDQELTSQVMPLVHSGTLKLLFDIIPMIPIFTITEDRVS